MTHTRYTFGEGDGHTEIVGKSVDGFLQLIRGPTVRGGIAGSLADYDAVSAAPTETG